MNAATILNDLQADAAAGKKINFRAVREQIHDAAEQTIDSSERVILLQVFHSVMNLIERDGSIAPEDMELFRTTRAQDYRLLLMREVLIGQNVSVELLNAVTHREVLAGRIVEEDELRQLAVKSLAETYLTVQELLKIEQKRLDAETNLLGWRRWFVRK